MSGQRRKAVVVPGLDHGTAPFPIAVRRGPFVVSSAIHGKDPDTGELPESVEGQVAGVFRNVRLVVEAAGGTPADIVKVTVFARSREVRPALNGPWRELFPDEEDRPVRHNVTADLPPGLLVQAEFLAVVEGDGD